MQLQMARIKNFRSLRDFQISFEPNTALIGGNGAGKSTVLRALDKFYSTTKHLDADDYYGRDPALTIEIELTFGNLNQQELEDFESRVRDGRLTVTRIFDGTSSSGRYFGVTLQHAGFSSIRGIGPLREKKSAYDSLRASSESYASLPSVRGGGDIEACLQQWERNNPQELVLLRDDGQFFGFQNAGRGALQRYTSFVFVPAVREASLDATDTKSSAIGRLLELVVKSAILQRQDVLSFQRDVTERYQQLVAPENMPELGALAQRLTNDLRSIYRDSAVDLAWRSAQAIDVPLPAADVSLSDDGYGGPVDRQGHGLQRAFVFTLLQHLARTSTSNAVAPIQGEGEVPQPGQEVSSLVAPSLIIAIEEPELYQHPTKQRHLSNVLRALSEGALPGSSGPTQIIYGSHSPNFVSLGKAHEVRLLRRVPSGQGSLKEAQVSSLDLEQVAAMLEQSHGKPRGTYTGAALMPRLHILDSEISEGFFANGVVLVEGPSDRAALYAVAQVLGLNFQSEGIAVVPVVGKNNLDRPYAVFASLCVPVFVIWDLDGDLESPANQALFRLVGPRFDPGQSDGSTEVSDRFACFEVDLESTLAGDIGPDLYRASLQKACVPYGLVPDKQTNKIPDVMCDALSIAAESGGRAGTLERVIRSIWALMASK